MHKPTTFESSSTAVIERFMANKSTAVLPRSNVPYEVWKAQQDYASLLTSDFGREMDERKQVARAKYGLVYPAISRHAFVRVYAGMTKVTMPFYRKPPEKPPQRGIIHGMSAKSRKRMLEGIAQWSNFDIGRAYFVTITYHEEYGVHFSAWKRDIELLEKRMKRSFSEMGGLWKLEFQTRGAPHFHLLVSGVDAVQSEMVEWVTKNWAEIAHSTSEYKGKYATNVRRVYSLRHAMHYCAKYMTKDVPLYVNPDSDGVLEPIPTGRIWAFFGKVNREPIVEFLTSPKQAKQWRVGVITFLVKRGSRFADRLSRMDENRSWSVFGIGMHHNSPDVYQWRQFIRHQYRLSNVDIDEKVQSVSCFKDR